MENQGERKFSKRFVIGLVMVILIAAGLFGGWYFFGPCGVARVNSANEDIGKILQQWSAANAVAGNTSRIALDGPIMRLQEIRQQASELKVPPCLEDAKHNLVLGMDEAIDGYLAFMRQANNTLVESKFSNAALYMGQVADKLQDVKSCAPFCK